MSDSAPSELREVLPKERAFPNGSISQYEAATASWLAKSLMWSFISCILGALLFYCIAAGRLLGRPAADLPLMKELLESAKGPLAQIASVFSPLMGFVLGYYFSKRELKDL